MKQASYLILSILIITSCAYSSQRPDVVDRSIAQKAQSVTLQPLLTLIKLSLLVMQMLEQLLELLLALLQDNP